MSNDNPIQIVHVYTVSLCLHFQLILQCVDFSSLSYPRYGYHISRTCYVICNDPPTIHKIFSRLRNFGGPGVYPESCGDYCITHIRDVTTGYDSSQPDKKCVCQSSSFVYFLIDDKQFDWNKCSFNISFRSFHCQEIAKWSHSHFRMALLQHLGPAGLSQRSSVTQNSVQHQENGSYLQLKFSDE